MLFRICGILGEKLPIMCSYRFKNDTNAGATTFGVMDDLGYTHDVNGFELSFGIGVTIDFSWEFYKKVGIMHESEVEDE